MKIDDIKVNLKIDSTELDSALKKAKELNNVLKEINNNKIINNNSIEKIQCGCNNEEHFHIQEINGAIYLICSNCDALLDDWINRKDAEYLLDLEMIDEYVKYPIKIKR